MKKDKFRFSLGKMFLEEGRQEIKGMNPKAIWECNSTIALFIQTCLQNMIKYQHGHPALFTEEKWDKTLQDLALDFGSLIDWEKNIFVTPNDSIKNRLPESIQSLMGRNVNTLTEEEYILLGQERRKYVKKVFEKLAEIFDDLWD